MKRSSLKRKTSLRNHKPMQRVPAKRQKSRPAGPHPYVAAVHELPCAVAKYGVPWPTSPAGLGCSFVIEADHMGDWSDGRGVGQKPDQTTCVSLCTKHHRERHAGNGVFAQASKAELQDWRRDMIARTRTEVYARYPGLCMTSDSTAPTIADTTAPDASPQIADERPTW